MILRIDCANESFALFFLFRVVGGGRGFVISYYFSSRTTELV